MTGKIFRSTVFVAVLVLLCALGVVMGILYNHFSGVQTAQLADELSLAATGTQSYGKSFLENVHSQRFRLTWVAADGTVLFDTQVDPSAMEDHADREEIREALETGRGSSTRISQTLTQRTLYEAVRLDDGSVLRISSSQVSAWALILDVFQPVLLIAVAAIVLSALLARRMAKRIVEPLNKLDLEQPLNNTVYEEISPLLQRIHQQHMQISGQLETLQRKTDEFVQITGSLKEGLMVLDREGTVLSINPTAAALFAAGEDCVGKNFFFLDGSPKLRKALNDALDKGQGITREQRGDREYQFDLSRIESDGTVIGAVILAFDITESSNAERLRREFSANVSHELKTPLQSIMGSAELLETGLAKQEDVPRFINNIRKEASRLVSLIEDIIRLSQLDEGVDLPMEDVELLELAQEVSAAMADRAGQKNVSLQVCGESFTVSGVRRLLYEILYNLCDNAIKYNVPGGKVCITVKEPALCVEDTGIGIPPEHQSRVFERFYRVDKSHSRASGGTGLGLSIVKHAAACHNAQLKLDSEPGKGTKICVIF